MPSCGSCGTNIVVTHTQKKTVNPCDPVQPPCPTLCVKCVECKPKPICVPECRKSIKDKCRVKPCPPCACKPCPPKDCVRRTKCKFYSVKDKCRQNKPCPPVQEQHSCTGTCCH